MVAASDISPSKGEDVDSLVSQTTALVDSGRWKLCDNGKGLERKFKFRTFKATWVITAFRSNVHDDIVANLVFPGLHEHGGSRM